MGYKHNWRLQARCVCKKMTGLWSHSPMIQRLQHTQRSHWCSTLTSAQLENLQYLQGPNPNSAQLRKIFVIGHAVAEWDEERRRVASASSAHPLHPGVDQTAATASPGHLRWCHLDLIASRFTLCPAHKELLWFCSASSLLGGQNIPRALNSTGYLLLILSIISPSVNNVCREAFRPHFSRENIMWNSKDGNTNPKIFH